MPANLRVQSSEFIDETVRISFKFDGKTYHGFSLNIDMDLAPFKIINPCGYEGLEVTDLKALGKNTEMKVVVDDIKSILDVKLRKIDQSE